MKMWAKKIPCNEASFNWEHHSIQSLSIHDVHILYFFLQIPIELQLISANSITPLLFSIESEYKWRKECYFDDSVFAAVATKFYLLYTRLLKCHYVNVCVCILNEIKFIDSEYLFEWSESCEVQGGNIGSTAITLNVNMPAYA